MKRLALILALLAAPAYAQQQPPSNEAIQQALGAKLMEEINSNIQLRAQLGELNVKLKQLQDKQKDAPPDQQAEKK